MGENADGVTPTRASRMLQRALAHSSRGNYSLAEKWLRRALKSAGPRANGFVADRPALWNELGMVCKYLGQLDSAERYYRLALRHARSSTNDPDRQFFLANLYHNLGGLEHSRQRFRRAEKYARKGLELRRACAPSDKLALASDQAAMAAILDGLGRYRESEKLYRQALRTYRRELGASHAEMAVILNNLGALYQATGRPRKAESSYLAALKMKRRILGRAHPDVAVTLNNLGMLYSSLGCHVTARSSFKKALQILDSTFRHSHPTTCCVQSNLTKCTRSQ